jgi:hypothetical protein
MVASAGETDRDLAWIQLAEISGVYNIIEFKYYNFKLYNVYNVYNVYRFKIILFIII